MKKIRFLFVAIALLLSAGSADAQSKKELKAQAKIQKEIDETTTDSGKRVFKSKLEYLVFEASPTFEFVDGTIFIDIIIRNLSSTDLLLTLFGSGSEKTYNTYAKDSEDRYYSPNYKSGRYTFAFGGSNNFNGNCRNIFVPAVGVLKMRLRINHISPETKRLTELSFGYCSELESPPITRKAVLKELPRKVE